MLRSPGPVHGAWVASGLEVADLRLASCEMIGCDRANLGPTIWCCLGLVEGVSGSHRANRGRLSRRGDHDAEQVWTQRGDSERDRPARSRLVEPHGHHYGWLTGS